MAWHHGISFLLCTALNLLTTSFIAQLCGSWTKLDYECEYRQEKNCQKAATVVLWYGRVLLVFSGTGHHDRHTTLLSPAELSGTI